MFDIALFVTNRQRLTRLTNDFYLRESPLFSHDNQTKETALRQRYQSSNNVDQFRSLAKDTDGVFFRGNELREYY